MKNIKVDRQEKTASNIRNKPHGPEEEKKAELQQKMVIYQLMQKRLEELQQQAVLMERKFVELETTRNTISDIEKTEKGGDMFFPLGSGVFVKGKASSDKSLMVELGAGLVSMKDTKSANDFLEKKGKDIEDSGKDLEKELKKTVEKLNGIAHQLQEMVGQR